MVGLSLPLDVDGLRGQGPQGCGELVRHSVPRGAGPRADLHELRAGTRRRGEAGAHRCGGYRVGVASGGVPSDARTRAQGDCDDRQSVPHRRGGERLRHGQHARVVRERTGRGGGERPRHDRGHGGGRGQQVRHLHARQGAGGPCLLRALAPCEGRVDGPLSGKALPSDPLAGRTAAFVCGLGAFRGLFRGNPIRGRPAAVFPDRRALSAPDRRPFRRAIRRLVDPVACCGALHGGGMQ